MKHLQRKYCLCAPPNHGQLPKERIYPLPIKKTHQEGRCRLWKQKRSQTATCISKSGGKVVHYTSQLLKVYFD